MWRRLESGVGWATVAGCVLALFALLHAGCGTGLGGAIPISTGTGGSTTGSGDADTGSDTGGQNPADGTTDDTTDDAEPGDEDDGSGDTGSAPASLTLRFTQTSSYSLDGITHTLRAEGSGQATVVVPARTSVAVQVPYSVEYDLRGKNVQGQQYVPAPSYFVLDGVIEWTVTYEPQGGQACVRLSGVVRQEGSEVVTTTLVAHEVYLLVGEDVYGTFEAPGSGYIPAQILSEDRCGSPYRWTYTYSRDVGAEVETFQTTVSLERR